MTGRRPFCSPSAALLLVPLSLLGTFSPVAVGLLTRSAEESGGVAGLVYGISTVGNVVGTLLTTFMLIPTIGSRSITYLYAVALAVCAGILFLPIGKKSLVMRKHRFFSLAAAVVGHCAGAVFIARNSASAQSASRSGAEADFTDGWSGDRAMTDIAAQLKFTPRSLDTPGHQQTIDYIEAAIGENAVQRDRQAALDLSRRGRQRTTRMTNLIARLDPANPPPHHRRHAL